MIEKIISGGQTGADQGGLEAAESMGIATGGVAPYNFMTELGARRAFMERYGLVPGPYDRKTYPVRTKLNVENSDGTVWFGHVGTPGYQATIGHAERVQKPYIINPSVESFREWVKQHDVRVLNVAGNRESKNCGIRDRVVYFLRTALLQESTACVLCGGSGEVVNRPSRVIGATGYGVDETLEPCSVCGGCGKY